jgi:hypothetical protein
MTNNPVSGGTYEDEKANAGVGPNSGLATTGTGRDSQAARLRDCFGFGTDSTDYGQSLGGCQPG